MVFTNNKFNINLAGTLTIPDGPGPFPAVILISGSGLQNRDEELLGHKPFLVIADHLTRNGIAVLRYDDRGFGKSQGNAFTSTSADLATDTEAALEFPGNIVYARVSRGERSPLLDQNNVLSGRQGSHGAGRGERILNSRGESGADQVKGG